MTDLLKRIDSWIAEYIPNDLAELLADCRAEIASLHEAAQQQAVVIERLSKPYVPMTDDELNALDYTGSNIAETVERAVIERAGLEIKDD